MAAIPVQIEIIDIQGYITIAAYLHYFTPGSLKFQTHVHLYRTNLSSHLLDTSDSLETTRRWLQKEETPYPGYCRAPGSGVCLPMLCNCEKLTQIWNTIKNTQSRLKGVRRLWK